MNAKLSESKGTYQENLPAILQENVVVGQFLLAFEKILSGSRLLSEKAEIIKGESQNPPGLEAVLDKISDYFDPQKTHEEFLPWLADWVALSLRDDWDVEVKRAFIQNIVGLYRKRGTKEGLQEILSIYLENSGFGKKVEVFDNFTHFPNYFQVRLTLNDRDPDKYWRQAKIAKAIIDREKPAQTFYSLRILMPTMQLTRRSRGGYEVKLFAPIPEQTFTIEVQITPTLGNRDGLDRLAEQFAIQLQGKSREISLAAPETIIAEDSFSVNYTLSYQILQENLEGFQVKLSNRTDKDFAGNLAIKFYFHINESEHSQTLIEEAIAISPVLQIVRLDENQEIIAGNTILQRDRQPEGMRITENLWTQPYRFQLFTPPPIQGLQPDIISLVETIELVAIVTVTQPQSITIDVLKKLAVRFEDEVSDFNLFTPEMSIDREEIRIKRRLDYRQFMQTIDRLRVTVKNLNNIEIVGRVAVRVSLDINQRLSTYTLLEEDFTLPAVPLNKILQICQREDIGENVERPTIPTILGSTSQSIN
ncbi:MAG: phage tail protein [Spirulina sp.]